MAVLFSRSTPNSERLLPPFTGLDLERRVASGGRPQTGWRRSGTLV